MQEQPNFGSLLKWYRRRAQLTQEALAERSNYSPHYVSMLERGVRLPHPVTIDLLADALGLEESARQILHAATCPRPARPSGAVPRPRPFGPLIGRERDMARLMALLRRDDVRLLTITGPGGVGKTRLAEQVGLEMESTFADGTVFVDLAAVHDADDVAPAMARALSVRDAAGGSIVERLVEALNNQERLVVLDSVERVLDAAPLFVELLRACPRLRLLATSRAPLRLHQEQELPLEPLALPAADQRRLPSEIAHTPAVALFLQRARLVRPDHPIREEELVVVADICERIDGLPLAIELAAARLKHLSLHTLRDRLEHRLQILAGGPRDRPARQQRMRDTIAWSFDLLAESEQRLFGQLSVFAGTWSLEAAEDVCGSGRESEAVLDGMGALVDQSLVVLVEWGGDGPRYRMLDTIRDFATEQLAESGQADAVERRHAGYYLQHVERAEPALQGSEHGSWHRQLADDQDNFRAALHWLLQEGEAERALRLAGAMWRFWQRHGDFREGREWLETTLAAAPQASPDLRGKALWGAIWLAFHQGDYAHGRNLSTSYLQLARTHSDRPGMRHAVTGLGIAALEEGRYAEATPWLEEALAISRGLGRSWHLGASHLNLGLATMHAGDLLRATDFLEQALKIFRDLGDDAFAARTLGYLGYAALFGGDHDGADRRLQESLQTFQELQEPTGIAESLEGLAAVRAAMGHGLVAAKLAAVAARLRADLAAQPHAFDRDASHAYLEQARRHLGEAAWTTAWEAGQAMTLEQAIAHASTN